MKDFLCLRYFVWHLCFQKIMYWNFNVFRYSCFRSRVNLGTTLGICSREKKNSTRRRPIHVQLSSGKITNSINARFPVLAPTGLVKTVPWMGRSWPTSLLTQNRRRHRGRESLRNSIKEINEKDISVPYRHGGGWSRKINAWHLYTLMVYL